MEEGKGTDEITRQAFAFQPRPRPCGVDTAEMPAPMQLVGKFEVMEDAVDGLDNLHRGICSSREMLAEG